VVGLDQQAHQGFRVAGSALVAQNLKPGEEVTFTLEIACSRGRLG
jgi:hypothetical protein